MPILFILTQRDNAVIETRNGEDTSQSLVAGGWWLVAGGLINHIVRSLSARYQLSSPSLHFASMEVGNIAIIDFARQLAAGGCSAAVLQ